MTIINPRRHVEMKVARQDKIIVTGPDELTTGRWFILMIRIIAVVGWLKQ